MTLDNLSLPELYRLRDLASLKIHQKRHNAVPVNPAVVGPLVDLWNASCELELRSTDAGYLLDTHLSLDIQVINGCAVFYVLDRGRPVLFEGGVKYWNFNKAGIVAAAIKLEFMYV
jgi:hypothetical protein